MKIKSEIWDGITPSLYAHLKIDGAFLRIKKDEQGEIKCLSSIDTDLTTAITNCKPRWLVNLYKNMPFNSCILGELFYYDTVNRKGLPASYIKTGLANGENYYDENSTDITVSKKLMKGQGQQQQEQQQYQLCFSGFAIEYGFPGIDHNSELDQVEIKLMALGIDVPPAISFRYSEEFPSKEELLDKYLQRDYFKNRTKFDYSTLAEGWMLKSGNLTGWKKVKKENTIDCFIAGYIPGKGKYYGKVGSLICCVYNAAGAAMQIATAGGFNDEIRDWLTEQFKSNKDELIGQVIEIQYQFVATQGRLRHPRFKNWRDDKLAEECLTSQDEELVKYWG